MQVPPRLLCRARPRARNDSATPFQRLNPAPAPLSVTACPRLGPHDTSALAPTTGEVRPTEPLSIRMGRDANRQAKQMRQTMTRSGRKRAATRREPSGRARRDPQAETLAEMMLEAAYEVGLYVASVDLQ